MQDQPTWTLKQIMEDTPSRKAGFSFDNEHRLRREVAQDIQHMGLKLQ